MWARTTNGKRMPIDAEDQGGWLVPKQVDAGNVLLDSGSWPDDAVVRIVAAGAGRHASHFSTCPDSDEWRRR